MKIGVPKEIKNRENRVGCTPAGVRALVQSGHEVWIQTQAGVGSGFVDSDYEKVGGKIVPQASDAWAAQMVIKVKEPLEQEYQFLRKDLILFTYLHLAAEKNLSAALVESKCTSIAYETIQEKDGSLPLLRPMSEVAGRMSAQVGAFYLQSSWSSQSTGKGILLGGVPGVLPGKVTVLGGGVAGSHAAKVALGMGAIVTIIDINVPRLEHLENVFNGRVLTLSSNFDSIWQSVSQADLLIGAVLVPGAKAPKLVSRELIENMNPGSVVVDIAVDQGGCIETCRPTSHEDPTFMVGDVVHYCVTNMPGAVARTSTFALTNVTLRYALEIANYGYELAAKRNVAISKGFNTFDGKIVYAPVGEAHGMPSSPLPF